MIKKSPAFREALFSLSAHTGAWARRSHDRFLGVIDKDNSPETSYVPRIVGAIQAAHAAELVPHRVPLASEDTPDIAESLEPVVLHSLKWEAISA
jgi:hypothetical protein